MAKNAVVGEHLFYRWAGSWGQPAAFTDALYRPRAQCCGAAHRRACRAACDSGLRPARARSPRRSRKSPAPRRSSSLPRCAATSASRCASTSPRARRRRTSRRPIMTKKFDFSDNLKYALSPETVAANQQPLGSPRLPRAAAAAAPRLPGALIAVAVSRAARSAASRREGQLNPQPDSVEPSVDREIVARQHRRRGPLPPCHRQRRERSRLAQRVAILQAHHCIVERGTAVEHRLPGSSRKRRWQSRLAAASPISSFGPVKAQRLPDRAVDRIDMEPLAIGSEAGRGADARSAVVRPPPRSSRAAVRSAP